MSDIIRENLGILLVYVLVNCSGRISFSQILVYFRYLLIAKKLNYFIISSDVGFEINQFRLSFIVRRSSFAIRR